jgi:hypothetical protein
MAFCPFALLPFSLLPSSLFAFRFSLFAFRSSLCPLALVPRVAADAVIKPVTATEMFQLRQISI